MLNNLHVSKLVASCSLLVSRFASQRDKPLMGGFLITTCLINQLIVSPSSSKTMGSLESCVSTDSIVVAFVALPNKKFVSRHPSGKEPLCTDRTSAASQESNPSHHSSAKASFDDNPFLFGYSNAKC